MKRQYIYFTLLFIFAFSCKKNTDVVPYIKNELRAPAYPLVMLDPHVNGWAVTDMLYDQNIKHLTGRENALIGAIRVDGSVYRFMGAEKIPLKALAPISTEEEWEGRYTFLQPEPGWEEPDYNDDKWKVGKAAFGTIGELNVQTLWPSQNIWVRREIALNESLSPENKLILRYSHDDIFELYINGIQLVKTGEEWHKNVEIEIPEEIIATIDRKIVIAAHCYNTTDGGLVDFGIYFQNDETYFEKTASQKSVEVQATQTNYIFECGDIELKLSFISSLILDDLELMSRPVNYISYEINALDGQNHEIEMYFEAAPNWATSSDLASNIVEFYEQDNILFTKSGCTEQKILDRHANGWGYFYLGAEKANATSAIGHPIDLRASFTHKGSLSSDAVSLENKNMAISQQLGRVKRGSGKIMLGYDDIYAIQYFGNNLRPYWNRKGNQTIEQQFAKANQEYKDVVKRCKALDHKIMIQARIIGGKEYAELCALAYRQTAAAGKLVESPQGELLMLNNELGTVDVFYPSTSLFLYFNTELVKALMNPIFYYCESGKWTKSYPPHDVGVYPIASHQDFYDLPVEEAGNMLIMNAAIAAVDGNARYAEKHWEILSLWNDFLVSVGVDTKNEGSSDIFTPHLPHNANLSIKGILGIASYSYLAEKLGKYDLAEKYLTKAREMAVEWEVKANAGDHYRLAFDLPDDTWSQKYNLVWDKVLNLNIFADSIAAKEIAFYQKQQNKYGLPLDSRDISAKTDWLLWTATMAEDKETFREFVQPLHRFINETNDRVPMSDFYNTDIPTIRGHAGRVVVGAYYMKMLDNKLDKQNESN